MQRRRAQSQSRRARTVTAATTPPAQITFFPKKRDRAKTEAAVPVFRDRDRTDPLGEQARRAIESDRAAHARREPRSWQPDRDALTYHRQKLAQLLNGDRHALARTSQRERMEIAAFGHGLYEEGRLREARVVFEGLVALEPREAFPYTVLGAIYLAQDDLRRALALFEAALELDPADAAALCYRGEIRLSLGQRARGLGDLRRAAEVDTPDSPFADRARAAIEAERERSRRTPGAT